MFMALLLLTASAASLSSFPAQVYPPSDPGLHLPSNQPAPYLILPKAVYKLVNSSSNATAATLKTAPSHPANGSDFVFGARGPGDVLLLRTTVYKRPRFWNFYATKEITFPPPRSPLRVNITEVSAYDRGFNKTGGFIKITGGGIGTGNVTILFTSHRNAPIHFALEIYGKPKKV